MNIMVHFVRLALCALACNLVPAPCSADEPVKLDRNAPVHLEFPDLPNTLAGMVAGQPRRAALDAILPDNYTREGKYPLFVYIKGGSGGPDDAGVMAREIVGTKDFIAVSVPLFKKTQPAGQTRPVVTEDLPVVSVAYRTMFEKLAAAVPNIDWDRSVIGGHSNGAHTLAVLLAGDDEYIRKRFRSFWLHEGGFALLRGEPKLARNTRLLVLVADDGLTGPSEFRKRLIDQLAMYEGKARLAGIDVRTVVMRGYGHDVPPEYMRNVRQFARREAIEDVVATAKSQAAKLSFPLKAHPDSTAWNDLLVSDLTNLTFPGGAWSYRGGILTATKDGDIWTKATHADCVIDFEYRYEKWADGGVFLYNSDPKNRTSSIVEIQLGDDANPRWKGNPAMGLTGAFVGRQKPAKRAAKPVGEWNRMTLVCQGRLITTLLNGEIVSEIDLSRWTSGTENPDGTTIPKPLQGMPWSKLPTKGRIGLQGRQDGAAATFRNLKLLRLD